MRSVIYLWKPEIVTFAKGSRALKDVLNFISNCICARSMIASWITMKTSLPVNSYFLTEISVRLPQKWFIFIIFIQKSRSKNPNPGWLQGYFGCKKNHRWRLVLAACNFLSSHPFSSFRKIRIEYLSPFWVCVVFFWQIHFETAMDSYVSVLSRNYGRLTLKPSAPTICIFCFVMSSK